jgi:CubicO group peptidase (beta-lactamase class C family)
MTVKMNVNCLKCSLPALFLLFFQVIFAQADFSGVESILKQNQKIFGKDVTVMVNKEGRNIYKYETEEFKLKTASPIGNTSTWLTAAVVMIFVDEGKISLDDPVSKYLPIFEKYLKGYITIRQCLAHTTGIQSDPAGLASIVQKNKFSSLEEAVNTFVSRRQIENNAGEAFKFSNVGPDIAARVIEVVSKKTFDRVSAEKLFRPLGMRNTSFYNEKGAVNPASGAVSSAFDYMNFMNMILNKGMHNGKRILSEASIMEMQKQQYGDLPVKYVPKLVEGFGHGLGLWLQETDDAGNATVISSPGLFGTWAWIDLKRNYAAIILPEKEENDQKKETFLAIKDQIDEHIRQIN